MDVSILADDLTGACDTGTLFAGKHPVPVAVWPRRPPRALIRVLDTETRAAGGDEAARRVEAAAAGSPAATRWFKKIDSTLRGHIGEEVDALMRATGAAGAVLTPAFPAQGRIVLDRLLLVDGVPVTETPVARDPDFPAPASASVIDLLRPSCDRPLAWIPIDQVRAGVHALAARLTRLSGTVAVADAEVDEDLGRLVDAVLALPRPPLLVGAAGLARALAQRLGVLAEQVALPSGPRWLIVAGSRHPATRRQIAAARAAGLAVVASPDEEVTDRRAIAVRVADEARRLLERDAFDVVVVTGGATAVALFSALDAERIDLVGAPAPGLAVGYLRAPRWPALPVVTKAGAFGAPDLLVSLATSGGEA
jgi:uncharacterized protein YgbK (DUF1537 family)